MDKMGKYIEDRKFVSWVFTPDEETNNFFDAYIHEHPEEKESILRAKKELKLLSISEMKPPFNKGIEIYQGILNQIQKMDHHKRWFMPKQIAQYAAVALVFFAFGTLLMYLTNTGIKDIRLSEEQLLKGAHYYPVLYLANGSSFEIKNDIQKLDFSEANKCILGNDTINVSQTGKNNDRLNVLVVPFGQRMQLVLSDKSKVWLNAGSRLLFPPDFDNNNRKVFISGEAYFDVSHNEKSPFWVNTSTISVKVLGTKFNLESYADENNVVTTLEEGHVQVIDKRSVFSKLKADLQPGQMAIYNKTKESTKLYETQYELHTLWKEGFLRFDMLPVSQLLKKVERFYNIQIEINDSKALSEKLRGKLDLNAGKEEVLEYLSKLTGKEVNKVNTSTYILK